jgi:hypothetical protein
MDDFDLASELAVSPLDVPQLPTPDAMPNAPQQQKPGLGQLASMLPLLAAAMKQGGRSGIAGFLQGMARARQAKQQGAQVDFQNQRQVAGDQRAQQSQQWQQSYQQRVLAQQDAARKQQFLQQFTTGLQGLDNDEAIRAYLELQGGQADALGIRRDALQGYVSRALPPSALQKRAAEKKIAELEKQHGDKWITIGPSFSYQMPGEDQPIPFKELLRRSGRTQTAPLPIAAAQQPNTPEEQFYQQYAIENGAKAFSELPTAKQAAARKQWMQADDRPLQQPGRTQAQVGTLARSWDALPIVKTTQKMAEAVSFAESLNPNTTNPADDQALIYAFAKAMDPDSVVREGEYATVQKYAQSWAESFGFNAARIFSNTQFLTPQARQNMKATIRARYRAGKGQYDNVRRSYVSKINKLTQLGDGEDYLTDYGGGFPAEAPAQPSGAAPGGAGASYQDYLRSRGQK